MSGAVHEAKAIAPRTAERRVETQRLVQSLGLVAVLIVVVVVFHILTDGIFISSRNIPLLLRQAAVTAIVAAGVCLVMVSGQIDLSIGSSVGLCGILAAWMVKEQGMPVGTAIVLTIVAGVVMGGLQGTISAALGVPSFIVTLGGLLVFRGVGLVITEGNTIAGFPSSFATIGQGGVSYAVAVMIGLVAIAIALVPAARGVLARGRPSVTDLLRLFGAVAATVALLLLLDPDLGLPVPVVIAISVAIVLAAIARLTRFGRHLYAVGGNPAAAELAGIHVGRTTIKVFLLMGVLYGVAGLVLVSRLNGAPPDGASPLELDAIAAAVIGGTSLNGGVGSVSGAVVGALLLASVTNGLNLLGVQTFWQYVATGLILVVAVAADIKVRGRS
jgi:D-xylose transport system permease protein